MDGKELWRLDLGKQEHPGGYAGSPVLHQNLCILYASPGPQSFLLAVDKRTGKEVWRVELPPGDAPKDRTDSFAGRANGDVGSWSTPIIVHIDGRDELILSVPGMVRAFAPETGQEIWRCGGLSPVIYCSPVYGEETVVAASSFGGSELAVHAGGSGDVTEINRLWKHPRSKQRRGSGVISGGRFYILDTPGLAECLDLKTGATVWEARLRGSAPPSTSLSSMVLSGERIYVLNQAGDTFVIRAGPQFEKLALNSIGDGPTNASLAVSDGELFIRTHKHLWCIGAR
jgi:outer membrane protein assembly factor BamB